MRGIGEAVAGRAVVVMYSRKTGPTYYTRLMSSWRPKRMRSELKESAKFKYGRIDSKIQRSGGDFSCKN